MKTLLILFVSVMSSSAYSGIFHCEIKNLATAEILAQTDFSNTSLLKGIDVTPQKMELRHNLMSANITISHNLSAPEVFALTIEAFEVLNTASEKFIISLETLYSQGQYLLGQVANEITGLGDTTMTSCTWSN